MSIYATLWEIALPRRSIVGFKFLPGGEKQLLRKEDRPVLKRRR
jgi:hypothetical protein